MHGLLRPSKCTKTCTAAMSRLLACMQNAPACMRLAWCLHSACMDLALPLYGLERTFCVSLHDASSRMLRVDASRHAQLLLHLLWFMCTQCFFSCRLRPTQARSSAGAGYFPARLLRLRQTDLRSFAVGSRRPASKKLLHWIESGTILIAPVRLCRARPGGGRGRGGKF